MKNKLKLAGSIVFCELAGVTGSFFTMNSISTWFATLNKPSFAPPNWIFGPVWTLLYATLGIVLWQLWQNREKKKFSLAWKLFWLQLLLNAIWTPIFFGMHKLNLAFAELFLLWLVVLWLITILFKIQKKSAWLLIPYFLWLTFAGALNLTFAMIN